ncbi:MAG TPA: FAD-dependent oxidoreductase, partial [Opitutales bacterium]|nr:FAD-dependent oxidoreductase [Opitutales bacterium]
EGRRQNNQIFEFLRKHCPGFENAFRCDSAAQVGVRETRHVKGLYTLTAEDLLEQREFPDVICRGGYPIDIHSPDGNGVNSSHMTSDGSYAIPYRSLLVERPRNLVVVGRCLSATSEAFAAVRVSPIAMAIGQAGGVAAALSVREKCAPADLDYGLLRETLILQGAKLT